MRALIFIGLFAVVFAFATLSDHGGALGVGQSTFTTYGWPRHWLQVRIRDTGNSTVENGQLQPRKRTISFQGIDPPSLVAAIGASAAIAGVLALPFLLVNRVKNEPDCSERRNHGPTARRPLDAKPSRP